METPSTQDFDSFQEKKNLRMPAFEVDESDLSSKDDGYSAVGSLLIGKPTKKQQSAVVICGFLAFFQTLGGLGRNVELEYCKN
jgi:hypothetical protein